MQFGFLRCPSSPLPITAAEAPASADEGVQVPLPSSCYAGIDRRRNPRRSKRWRLFGEHATRLGGYHGSGGALLRNKAIPAAQITDGLSNTMVVAEQSDWCIDTDGIATDCRSDAGHGFCMGDVCR